MKTNLEQVVIGINGELKNEFDSKKRKVISKENGETSVEFENLILRDLIILVLTTEKIRTDDLRGFKMVNEKTDKEKFDDFVLGMRIKDKKETEFSHDEIERILKLAHWLETNTYGALKYILTKDK